MQIIFVILGVTIVLWISVFAMLSSIMMSNQHKAITARGGLISFSLSLSIIVAFAFVTQKSNALGLVAFLILNTPLVPFTGGGFSFDPAYTYAVVGIITASLIVWLVNGLTKEV